MCIQIWRQTSISNKALCPTRIRVTSMKKKRNTLSVLTAIIIGCIFFVGCQKDDYVTAQHKHEIAQTKVFTFNVTCQGAGQQQAESGLITRLVGEINENDAVLVFMRVSFAQGGDSYWTAQPYTDADGRKYWYMVSDSGGLYFYVKTRDGYTWSNDINEWIKVVVIPYSVYSSNASKGVNHNSYEDVVKAYNINIE